MQVGLTVFGFIGNSFFLLFLCRRYANSSARNEVYFQRGEMSFWNNDSFYGVTSPQCAKRHLFLADYLNGAL